jgi:hypothetical protein
MRNRSRLAIYAGCFSVLTSAFAFGQTTWTVHATNGQETSSVVPTLTAGNGGGPRPASFGDFTFVLASDNSSLTIDGTVNNIDFTGSQTADTNDNLTAAHIHASSTVTPSTTAGVVWGFIGSPFNDNNPNDAVITPFASGVGGTIHVKWDTPEGNSTTLTTQLSNILTGHAYINFHTSQFGGGEIRGNLPEPSSSLVLLLAGLGGTSRGRRRSRIR